MFEKKENKIPDGYVETVDGFLVNKDKAKEITVNDILGFKTTHYYKQENAPAFDGVLLVPNEIFYYKNNVQVKKDGTPVGYYTEKEFDLLNKRIAFLQAELNKAYEGEINYKNSFNYLYDKKTKKDLKKKK